MNDSDISIDGRIKVLEERYNRLVRNGKNTDGEGVLRRIRRTINKAKRGVVLA